jgi:hypothetical protein
MRFRSFRPCAGLIEERLKSSGIVDLHEVAHFPKHACHDRPVVVLDGLADLPQAESAERAAVLLRLPDGATNLSYPNLRHRSSWEEALR